jgi:hypothetical protein
VRLSSSSVRTIVIAAAVNLMTGAVTYLYTLNIAIALVCLAAGVALVVAIAVGFDRYHHRLLGEFGIRTLVPYRADRPPTQVYPINERLALAHTRLWFLGVSAKSLWNSNLNDVMSSHDSKGCSFRFLILDPNGVSLRDRMHMEQSTSVAAAQDDIKAFVENVADLKRTLPGRDISVRFYDLLPVFWLVLADDHLFLQTFPQGAIGEDSPMLELVPSDEGGRGLFGPFIGYFEDIWRHHSTNALVARKAGG